MASNLHVPKERLEVFCRAHRIQRLSLFGSALRGELGPDSDIDLLVEFLPGCTPGFFKLIEMENELSQIFGGRRVDLRTPEELSRYIRDKVVSCAEVQYVSR
ncbi:MAG: nucleotidyltransferase family protein [Anaerohalosphaeraceae bacterium]